MRTALSRISGLWTIPAVMALYLLIALSQYQADLYRPSPNFPPGTASLRLIQALDLGLHSAVASILWLDTRTELPFLQYGYPKFAGDLNVINALDPKWSTPYAYTVLVLPDAVDLPNRLSETIKVGEKGIEKADPDWRIPFYMGALYQLDLKDDRNAARYFDITARTEGVPETIRRFATNYGFFPTLRDKVRGIWLQIYSSAQDKDTRDRAKAYMIRMDIVEYLQKALDRYHSLYGTYPSKIQTLADEKLVPSIPRDPFGFEFGIEDGVVAIKRPD